MRLSALTLLAIAVASPAAAQTYLDELRADNRLLARQEQARQRALAADREALVMESRLRTAAALQGLRAQRLESAAPIDLPALAPLDPRIAADLETMGKLQEKALAESNARILAIKPASEN